MPQPPPKESTAASTRAAASAYLIVSENSICKDCLCSYQHQKRQLPATYRRRVRSMTAQLKAPSLPEMSHTAKHRAPALGTKQQEVAVKLQVEGRTFM
jgi:hypothetical protein